LICLDETGSQDAASAEASKTSSDSTTSAAAGGSTRGTRRGRAKGKHLRLVSSKKLEQMKKNKENIGTRELIRVCF